MRAVLEAVDFPLAAPSANRSGFISPTCAGHVLASLDDRAASQEMRALLDWVHRQR